MGVGWGGGSIGNPFRNAKFLVLKDAEKCVTLQCCKFPSGHVLVSHRSKKRIWVGAGGGDDGFRLFLAQRGRLEEGEGGKKAGGVEGTDFLLFGACDAIT